MIVQMKIKEIMTKVWDLETFIAEQKAAVTAT